jgi:hypothetical protein
MSGVDRADLVWFFHLWADGDWQEPTAEFFQALADSKWSGDVRVNMVWDGYEQDTLDVIREYAQTHDGYVGYAHTKGAWNSIDINVPWRRAMFKYVVRDWRSCVAALDDGYDVVGIHWFHPDMNGVVHAPHYGGNIWMAKTEHLRTLPECLRNSRWDAEMWVALNNPKALDRFPGPNPQWPSITTYARLGIT